MSDWSYTPDSTYTIFDSLERPIEKEIDVLECNEWLGISEGDRKYKKNREKHTETVYSNITGKDIGYETKAFKYRKKNPKEDYPYYYTPVYNIEGKDRDELKNW